MVEVFVVAAKDREINGKLCQIKFCGKSADSRLNFIVNYVCVRIGYSFAKSTPKFESYDP